MARLAGAVAALVLASSVAPSAHAQAAAPPAQPAPTQPPPAQPAPAATPPPGQPAPPAAQPVYPSQPGYPAQPGQPHAGHPAPAGAYPAPNAWAPTPPGWKAPPEVPYKAGAPVPPGYHVEERPRGGLLITGYVILGVPYVIGVLLASSDGFDNQKGWLIVPVAGPWLTLGQRRDPCDQVDPDGIDCVGRTLADMGLIFDGILQATGGLLVVLGYTAQKKWLVRDDYGWTVTPARIGRDGHGAVLRGEF